MRGTLYCCSESIHKKALLAPDWRGRLCRRFDPLIFLVHHEVETVVETEGSRYSATLDPHRLVSICLRCVLSHLFQGPRAA